MVTIAKKRSQTASFQTQGRLLQELGERLVARADVALTELIKNAYDADAEQCTVDFQDSQLVVTDNGHGMTEKEFLTKWMAIATPDKQLNRESRKYKRTVTGSKGIGRFAARFLGQKLKVETIARKGGKKEKLTIIFDWPKIDKQAVIQDIKIPYAIETAGRDEPTGTTLTISRLRTDAKSTFTKQLRTDLLSIAYPYTGLEKGEFDRKSNKKGDPGFSIILPSGDLESEENLTEVIFENAYARLTIDCRKTYVQFVIYNKNGKELLSRRLKVKTGISGGFFADIRYFPRREGMFADKGVDGRKAWAWIHDNQNNGIGIVDHGFRIRPYGFGEDDWLQLSYSAAHRERNWKSPYTGELVTMPANAASDAALNPMLYLPSFHQLIGAVFVESVPSGDDTTDDLTPSMDREGFISNSGFKELKQVVRTGLEMLAYVDHREQRKEQRRERREKAKQLREDLTEAVAFIENVPGLAKSDRNAVVDRFQQLSTELDDHEEYYRVGVYKLEMMGLLGIMAGFVTHEMQRVLHDLNDMLTHTKRLERRDPKLKKIREKVEGSLKTITEQLDYSSSFITSVQQSQQDPGVYKARGAARLIANKFKSFTESRGITVKIGIEGSVEAPRIPKALYNGVAMNLFTNAIKAAVGGESASKEPQVTIKAWNEKGKHVIEFADNGIGIPPSIAKRIWDPLFTTTSAKDYNPLGSGMGLGLSLVKKLVSEVDGSIALVDPPPGFSTCFRVTYPMKKA